MKEIDDTPPPQSESELTIDQVMVSLVEMINELTLRVARLETQRTPEMENDDPEWFS